MFRSEGFSKQFRDTCQVWRGDFEDKLKAIGQSITKGRALLYLSESDKPVTQKQLAMLLNIEEPSVVRMVDSLVKRGLVKREPCNTDRRVNYIVLTTAAMPVVAQVQIIAAKAYDDALVGIPEDKLMVACEVMAMIVQNLGYGNEPETSKERKDLGLQLSPAVPTIDKMEGLPTIG